MTDALNIHATAIANGVTNADASASIEYGIEQTAENFGNGNASNTVSNDGTLNIVAIASASAVSGVAEADASISEQGIYQYGYADDGDFANTVTSNGALTINAVAAAHGASQASASATVETGIYQSGYAYDNHNVTNTIAIGTGGSIDIGAVATAVATAAGAVAGTNATANASISEYGIYQ